MKGSVKLPVFIDDARKYVNTTQLRAKYLGASYEAEYCQWQALHGLGSLMETASLIITPNAYLEGKLIASYPPDPIGDFDVTRATTATRVNSAGLVELVPYNVIRYSQEFDNASWSYYQATITPNVITAPDGTMTGDRLNQATGTGGNVVYSNETLSTGNITLSAYLKLGTGSFGAVSLYDGSWKNGYFNLTTGAVHYTDPGVTASIEDAGNGWYRCIITINSVSNSVTTNVGHVLNTGEFGYIWGAQLNEGTIKPYQKTETRLNIPRLDYSNGTCPSLLVEPQRTNRILWSEEFTNAAWSAIDTTISANTTISPEGIQNADTMAISSSTSRIFQYTGLGAGTYTASVYIKSLSGTPTIQFRMVVDGNDITDSIPTTTEWVRHDFTFTASASMDYFVLRGESGTGSVAIWGAQLELGSYGSSFIPTTSASVTRNADVISKTGISSLIGQTEGVLFCDIDLDADGSAFRVLVNLLGATSSEYITINSYNTTGYIYADISNTTNQALIVSSINSGRCRIALAYKNNDIALYINGTLIGTDNSATIPATSAIALNYLTSLGVERMNNIYSIALWKTRLTNDQLATLTTL